MSSFPGPPNATYAIRAPSGRGRGVPRLERQVAAPITEEVEHGAVLQLPDGGAGRDVQHPQSLVQDVAVIGVSDADEGPVCRQATGSLRPFEADAERSIVSDHLPGRFGVA